MAGDTGTLSVEELKARVKALEDDVRQFEICALKADIGLMKTERRLMAIRDSFARVEEASVRTLEYLCLELQALHEAVEAAGAVDATDDGEPTP
jgi:hypothetical protein